MMIGMLRLYELSPHPSILDGRFGPDTLSFKEIVAVSRGAKGNSYSFKFDGLVKNL